MTARRTGWPNRVLNFFSDCPVFRDRQFVAYSNSTYWVCTQRSQLEHVQKSSDHKFSTFQQAITAFSSTDGDPSGVGIQDTQSFTYCCVYFSAKPLRSLTPSVYIRFGVVSRLEYFGRIFGILIRGNQMDSDVFVFI